MSSTARTGEWTHTTSETALMSHLRNQVRRVLADMDETNAELDDVLAAAEVRLEDVQREIRDAQKIHHNYPYHGLDPQWPIWRWTR